LRFCSIIHKKLANIQMLIEGNETTSLVKTIETPLIFMVLHDWINSSNIIGQP